MEVGELRDAEWEVRDLLGEGIKEGVLEEVISRDGGEGAGGLEGIGAGGKEGEGKEGKEKERVVAELMFDAVKEATDAVGGVANVKCMRAWSGVFVVGG